MRILICALMALSLASCNDHVVFQERMEIEGKQWSYDNPLSFSFEVEDTTVLYDIYVDVEHSRTFGYQNLYTGIYTVAPSGDTTFQRISIDLTDKMGKWLGTCKGTECSNHYLIKGGQKFTSPGSYAITLAQYSREEVLSGIKSLALTIAMAED